MTFILKIIIKNKRLIFPKIYLQAIFFCSSSAWMTGALLKRSAPCTRRFWLPNPSSTNPPCQDRTHSRRFPWWSAPTRWTFPSPREEFRRQRCSGPWVMAAPISRRLQRTARISIRSSRLWRNGAGFRLKPARRSIAKSPSVLTRRCGRVAQRAEGSRPRSAATHAVP